MFFGFEISSSNVIDANFINWQFVLAEEKISHSIKKGICGHSYLKKNYENMIYIVDFMMSGQ